MQLNKKNKTQDVEVNKRITAVLNRILLLSMVYGIPWIISIFAWNISQRNPHSFPALLFCNFSMCLSRLTIVYCLFLIQCHNGSEYGQFLRIIHHYCCCCCFESTVDGEINNETKPKIDEEKNNETTNDSTEGTNLTISMEDADYFDADSSYTDTDCLELAAKADKAFFDRIRRSNENDIQQ